MIYNNQMKKKGLFGSIFNQCSICGRYFGSHDKFEHMVHDMGNSIMKAVEQAEKMPHEVVGGTMPNMKQPEMVVIPNLIKLQAEVQSDKKHAVNVFASHPDFWTDFGYWIEAMGFITYRAMKYQEWSKEKMLKHVSEQLGTCIDAHESIKLQMLTEKRK